MIKGVDVEGGDKMEEWARDYRILSSNTSSHRDLSRSNASFGVAALSCPPSSRSASPRASISAIASPPSSKRTSSLESAPTKNFSTLPLSSPSPDGPYIRRTDQAKRISLDLSSAASLDRRSSAAPLAVVLPPLSFTRRLIFSS